MLSEQRLFGSGKGHDAAFATLKKFIAILLNQEIRVWMRLPATLMMKVPATDFNYPRKSVNLGYSEFDISGLGSRDRRTRDFLK